MATKTLAEISIKISSGLTPLRRNPEFWKNGNVPWLKTEQLGEKYIYETNEHISEIALKKTSIRVVPKNTLSIAMYGEGKTRGNLSIIKKPMATNQACCNVEINPFEADFEYVYYFLKTQYEDLRNLSSGVRKNLNSNDLKNYPIGLPTTLNEQTRIASVLSVLDAKIEINHSINAELEAMAKTLYDYWFVQFDFPDANGKPYKTSGGKMVYNSTLKREIPEGWAEGTAKKLFKFNPTETIKSKQEVRHIDMARLHTSGFMTATPITKKFGGGAKFRNGDVLVARITPCLENGKTGLVTLLNEDEVACGSTEFIVMRGRHQGLEGFGICLARSDYLRKFAIANMTGTSGRKRIEASILETISIPIPPKLILSEFEEYLVSSMAKLTLNTKENQHLTQLRDWLLPMLMNGQITVK